MTETNVFELSQPGTFCDRTTEVLHSGARALLAQAAEAEVGASLDSHAETLTEDGRRRLARDVGAVRGHVAHAIIAQIETAGATAPIPSQINVRVRRVVEREVYRQRNLVERFFKKLKYFRRIATRYGKFPTSVLAALAHAFVRPWLRHYVST